MCIEMCIEHLIKQFYVLILLVLVVFVLFPSPAPESTLVEPFEKNPVLSACYAIVLTNMLRRSTIVHYFETCHEWLLGELRV